KPKVIVALGAVAAKTLLAINESMSNLRGRWYEFRPTGVRSNDPGWTGAKLAVTYHPAFLLRDPRQKKEAWKDLQMVMKKLGLKPPAKAAECRPSLAAAPLNLQLQYTISHWKICKRNGAPSMGVTELALPRVPPRKAASHPGGGALGLPAVL